MRLGLTIAAGLALVAGCGGSSGLKHGDAGSDAGAAPQDAGITDLPPIPTDGYTTTADGVGGYQLGPRLAPSVMPPSTGSTGCHTLQGIVRDFRGALPAWGGSLQPGGHPDFEVFEGRGITSGLVAPVLGPDRKPVYASQCELGAPVSSICPYGAMTTSKENFNQWYRSVEGVNETFLVYFLVVPRLNVVSTFSSDSFFPLDGKGFGNSGTDISFTVPHNYSFTTEIHTTFRYNGGESFTFQGDDDVWIFINGKLAVDLGGLHFSEAKTVDLDASATTFGIQKGAVYPLDLFNAERHSVNSDFRIDLNFPFEDCGYIVP